MTTISLTEFAGRVKHLLGEASQPVVWFLGAGCSISSGIPAASGLTSKWLGELQEMQGIESSQFEAWASRTFDRYDPADLAKIYGDALQRRHPSAWDRQQEIERICARGEPGYGYATFSQLITDPRYRALCNTILTTNFDDLISESLYVYGELGTRPQIITHDAVALYARPSALRATVIKLHGDAHFQPRNLGAEVQNIDVAVAEHIHSFIRQSVLVFVGYGGNDTSVTEFLKACPAPITAPPVYWIGRSKPSDELKAWLDRRDTLWVDHVDFDELMHLLRGALGIAHPTEDRWTRPRERYYTTWNAFEEGIAKKSPSDLKSALAVATSESARSLPDEWSYISRARSSEATDLEAADAVYREGLEGHPASAPLAGSYAVFLKNVRKDFDAAGKFYKQAVEIDPNNAINLGNYANFLADIRKDLDAAESFYKRAVVADPTYASNLGNYAVFLQDERKDSDTAETFYKRAIEADPNNANNLGNYAVFLKSVRKDFDAAETLYKRAIEADPNHAGHLGNYAAFLETERTDLDAAETLYKRAIEADPNHANNLGNYADFLENARKDSDAAETFYKRAIEADPSNGHVLGNYALFLETERKDLDAAEIVYKRAIEAEPNHANNLGNYADFLECQRKDFDAAETFYKRAIAVDPNHANNLGSYADFLERQRKDFDAAETFYKRAIAADPNHANNLGRYADFLEHRHKDFDAAETFYKRAIEADPTHAGHLGNYADFLENARHVPTAAGTYRARALSVAG